MNAGGIEVNLFTKIRLILKLNLETIPKVFHIWLSHMYMKNGGNAAASSISCSCSHIFHCFLVFHSICSNE